MKRAVTLLIAVAFVVSVAGTAFCRTLEEERDAVRGYLMVVDAKIIKYRKAGDTKKMKQLQTEKAGTLRRWEKIKSQMVVAAAPLPPPPPPKAITAQESISAKKSREGYWFVKGGIFGAAYTLKGGYMLARHQNISYSVDLGFGTGNNFSLTTVAGTARYNYNQDSAPDRWTPYIGAELNYSDFSRKVVEITPVTTTIEKGGAFGLGILAGMARSNLFVQLGYDFRTGGFGEIGYKF